MTTYILHGGYTREKNELNRSFYEELSKNVPDGGTILFCCFAGSDEDIDGKFEEEKENVSKESKGKKLNVVLATKEHFVEELANADTLYIRGGDTAKLLTQLKNYPGLKEAFVGKTVAGSSAGAYTLSTYFYSNTAGKVFEGLGILPIRIACHYKSLKEANNAGDPLTALDAYPHELELVVLKDYEWRVVQA